MSATMHVHRTRFAHIALSFLLLLAVLVTARSSAAHVSIDSPLEDEVLVIGQTVTVTWSDTILHEGKSYDIDLLPSMTANPAEFVVIAHGLSVATHSYAWKIPDAPCVECYLQITQVNVGVNYLNAIRIAIAPEAADGTGGAKSSSAGGAGSSSSSHAGLGGATQSSSGGASGSSSTQPSAHAGHTSSSSGSNGTGVDDPLPQDDGGSVTDGGATHATDATAGDSSDSLAGDANLPRVSPEVAAPGNDNRGNPSGCTLSSPDGGAARFVPLSCLALLAAWRRRRRTRS
jgi:hypothetical protein